MNRTRGCLLAATTAVALAAVGCKASSSTEMYIGGLLFPPTVTAGSICSYTANASGPFNLGPVVDLSLFPGSEPTYTGVFLVANQLQATGNESQVRAESSRVILKDAIVYVKDGAGNPISSFTTPVSGTLDPGSGTTPSYGVISILALDGRAGEILGTQILASGIGESAVADIKVRGTTVGGDSVESAVFHQKINACIGCLVEGVPAAGCGSTSTSTNNVPCEFGQDQAVACCSFALPICNGVLPKFDAGAP